MSQQLPQCVHARLLQRWFLIACAFWLCLGGLGACARFFQSSPNPDRTVEVSPFMVRCMRNAILTAERYNSASANSVEVNQAWNCLDQAIDDYLEHVYFEHHGANHVSGAHDDDYSAADLRQFAKRYFPSTTVSESMLTQALKLKRVVLGGAAEFVTRAELTRARVWIATLRTESLALLPYIPTILMQVPKEGADPELARAAARQLEQTAAAIAVLLGSAQGEYRLSDAIALLNETSAPWAGWLRKRGPLLAALKSFLIKPDGDSIAPEDWPREVTAGAKAYGLYVRYFYNLHGDKSGLTGAGLAALNDAMRDFFTLLEDSVASQPDRTIEWSTIDELLRQFYLACEQPLPLAEKTVKAILRPLIERVFNPESAEFGRPTMTGLTLSTAQQMRRDFFGWSDMQRMWDEVEARTKKNRIGFSEISSAWDLIPSAFPEHKQELALLLGQARPLAFSPGGTLLFERDSEHLNMDRDSFSSLNWKRLVIRAAVRGFAADPVAARWSGLSIEEFHAFYEAFRPLAIEIRMVAPDDDRAWSSAFQEATTFLFSSMGGQLISFVEGVDLIAFSLSGGKMSRVAYAEMNSHCQRFEPDGFGLAKLDIDCFRRRLPGKFADYYRALPGWQVLLAKMPAERWGSLVDAILKTVRMTREQPGKLESSNIDRMTMTAQYIETMFIRFDRDGDGFIDAHEAEVAFPYFRGILAKASHLSDPGDLWPLFTYLLAYGRPPASRLDGLSAAQSWAGFWWWKQRPSSWKIRCDRARVYVIFGALSNAY